MTHSSKSGVDTLHGQYRRRAVDVNPRAPLIPPAKHMDEARKQNCTDDVNREDASLNSIVPADPNVPV